MPTVVTALVVAVFLLASLAPAAANDAADEVFYHFMPIAWRDSDGDPDRFGDFGGMTASLDYLEALGVTAVWMNPIFPSPAYHGYQHGRADELNARLGPQAQFVAFVEAAHARGIRVFVDFVAYGISHDSPWFASAHGNPASPYDDWLAFTNAANTSYDGFTYSTWNGAPVGFINWNLDDPGPRGLVTQWAQKWLDPDGDGDFADGIDGYRLDHVWVVYGGASDDWGYNLGSFWVPWRDALRSVNPGVFLFAEQADWGSYGAELWPAFDAAFTKPFEFAARDALAWEWAQPLYDRMAATVAAARAAGHAGTFLCTIGNHDVSRLASVIGDGFAKGKAAAAVLLTQPYPPVIYFGDEIGMRGVKNTAYPGDAADLPMREPFKWRAAAGPPMSDYDLLCAAPAYARVAADHDGRSVEEQDGASGSLLEAYRALIALRRGSVALRRGGYAPVPTSEGSVWCFLREHTDQQVLVAINLAGGARAPVLDLSGFGVPPAGTTPVDLVTGASLPPLTPANQAAYPLALAPYQYRALAVMVTAPAPPVSLADGLDIPADFAAGALVATQDNATGLGDNVSELNRLYARPVPGALRLGLPGNLATDATGLCLLLDTGPGGQAVLDLSNQSPPPAGPDRLTGTRLDDGFAPDHLLFANAFGGTIYVDHYRLLATGGAQKAYLGQNSVGSGHGLLTGGVAPAGCEFALDNRNTAGVTDTDAAGAGTATAGFELVLPYGLLGIDPAMPGALGVAAFLLQPDGTVSNQWLPGLGGGWPLQARHRIHPTCAGA